ncbi:Imm7 family immunity protein [Streptomyces sp. NPDC091371]|uniref:Imm7 family immunity protein n=1 Tax=Streptomyces sp. NPDC091371 TaxID=3155303 RepID=UPI00341CE6D3
MFEYHGWITIRESPGDDDEARLAAIVEELGQRVEQLAPRYLLDLRWMNGTPSVHLGGHTNHSHSASDVLDFFAHVGAVAPGSYGLLHIRDDEDERGHENDFRVIRLARGQVSDHIEPLLSPCIPALEDPFTA